MPSMSQNILCWNNAVTMATPQIFFSQPSILYPRHITESKKYGFALFYRGEGFTFFSPSWPLHYKAASDVWAVGMSSLVAGGGSG